MSRVSIIAPLNRRERPGFPEGGGAGGFGPGMISPFILAGIALYQKMLILQEHFYSFEMSIF
jgi:hypothetical protein